MTRVLELQAIGCMQRNPLDIAKRNRAIHVMRTGSPEDVKEWAINSSTYNVPSFLITGGSGMGKTFSVQQVLSWLPPSIRHTKYRGQVINFVQITYLYVDCPPTGTMKGLLLQILLAIDLEVGTSFYAKYLNANLNTDVLLVSVAIILLNHGVGLLVLDEVQHLDVQRFAGVQATLNFFVSLMNVLRIPMLFIGTYKVLDVLGLCVRDMRRAMGIGSIDFEVYSEKETSILQNYYLRFLPGLHVRPITHELKQRIYKGILGFHFLQPNFVQRCASEMDFRKVDHLTDDIIDHYMNVEIRPLKPILDAYRSGNPEDIAKYDDLMSPTRIAALRNYQQRAAEEKEARGEAKTKTTRPASVGSFGVMGRTHPDFPKIDFSDEEIDAQCVLSRTIFGKGDVYPNLKSAGVIAEFVTEGRFPE